MHPTLPKLRDDEITSFLQMTQRKFPSIPRSITFSELIIIFLYLTFNLRPFESSNLPPVSGHFDLIPFTNASKHFVSSRELIPKHYCNCNLINKF